MFLPLSPNCQVASLESQAVIVNQFVVRQFQIAGKQDHIGPGFGCQVGSEQNDHVQRVWEILVEQLHLVSAGVEAIFDLGFLQVLVRDLAHIHRLAQSGCWTTFGRWTRIGEV